MIVFAAITPHPPIIVPGIGRKEDLERVKNTILAMEQLRTNLEKTKPETLIIISPHAPIIEPGKFTINSKLDLHGSFSDFGLDYVLDFKNDENAVKKISSFSNTVSIPVYLHEEFLDHGALVPLYYLTKNIKPKIVHLSFSMRDFETHYRYGEIINKVSSEKDQRIAIVASGDLSHRLSQSAPAGYDPRGKEFDTALINLLDKKDAKGILNLDPELIEAAGECGLRSIIILLGALKEKGYNFQRLNYECPFGVGYLTAQLVP